MMWLFVWDWFEVGAGSPPTGDPWSSSAPSSFSNGFVFWKCLVLRATSVSPYLAPQFARLVCCAHAGMGVPATN